MAQLDVLRLTCADAIKRVDEAKAEKKTAHQVALKEIEAKVLTYLAFALPHSALPNSWTSGVTLPRHPGAITSGN